MRKLLILWICSGCQPVEDVESAQQATYFASLSIWPTRSIPVCWEDDGWDLQKDTVRFYIESLYDYSEPEWTAEEQFYVHFTGWGRCQADSRGLRIHFSDERPHTLTVGAGLDGLHNNVVLNPTWDAFIRYLPFDTNFYWRRCNSTAQSQLDCLTISAAHEFGHVLGMYHEQQRPDTPLDCNEEFARTGGLGAIAIGPYDPQSIMNYCSPLWDNYGALSEGDREGLRRVYPAGWSAAISTGSELYTLGSAADQRQFCLDSDECEAGDFDGDGFLDLVAINRATGAARVNIGSGNGVMWATSGLCTGNQVCKVADVDGDHRADIVVFRGDSVGTADIFYSNGSSFYQSRVVNSSGASNTITGMCACGSHVCDVGDVDGDGMADLIEFNHGAPGGSVFVARRRYLSSLSAWGFEPKTKWHDWFCLAGETCAVGDLNADGKTDLVTFTKGGNGSVFVAFSTGTGFQGTGLRWHSYFCVGDEVCKVVDLNADHRADLLAITDAGTVYGALNVGNAFNGSGVVWNHRFCDAPQRCLAGTGGWGDVQLYSYNYRRPVVPYNPAAPRVDLPVSPGAALCSYTVNPNLGPLPQLY